MTTAPSVAPAAWRALAMGGAAAVCLAVALSLAALAVPRCVGAAEPDSEPPRVSDSPAAEAGPELELRYRPPAEEQGLEPRLVFPPPAAGSELSLGPRNGQRALLEFAAILLAENIRYWLDAGFVEDWQYELAWDDQKKKMLELDGFRFDSNAFETNWTHAAAGGLYYSLGRINNLGVGESFLLAAFASLYWESVVEWREVFSVNDTIFTDFGALSIGEPWFQLSRYLLTRESMAARVLGFIHPLMGLQSVLDPASLPRPTESQTLPGHGVYLALGAVTADSHYESDSGSAVNVGLRSRLALAPRYTAPGTESRRGWEVLSSNFTLAADFADGAAREIDGASGAVFYGRSWRDVGGDSRGYASTLGIGSAFTFFRKEPVTFYDAGKVKVRSETDLHLEEPRDFRDKYSIIHLFGPVYEAYWRGAALGLAWSVEAYPDFALVNPYALNAYSADHDVAGTKTTQLYYGYYYGYGASFKTRLEASAGPVTVGVAAALHYHASIEGLDRFEDDLAGDVHATDTWYRFDANFGVPIPGTPLAVEATARWSSRRGAMGGTVAKGTESRYALGVTYRL